MSWSARLTRSLESVAKTKWYLPIVSLLAALDAYVLVVPNEALLIGAVLAHRKKWVQSTFWITLGSAIGAASFAALTSWYGETIVHWLFPRLLTTPEWKESANYIRNHGYWGLAIVSFSPFPQHAAVAIAGLVRMPVGLVFISVFLGRALKYYLVSWCSVHAVHPIQTIRKKMAA